MYYEVNEHLSSNNEIINKLISHLNIIKKGLSKHYHPKISICIQKNNPEALSYIRVYSGVKDEEYDKKPVEILLDISFSGFPRPFKSSTYYYNGKTIEDCAEKAIKETNFIPQRRELINFINQGVINE